MKALILAAGRGSRLGSCSSDTAKCLLKVGDRPLIEHVLEMLAEAGVGPVGMVVGYCADEIRRVVGIRAEYIENPDWAITNSAASFLLGHEWAGDGPLLILNSDLLLHPGILDRVLEAGEDTLAYDSSSGNGREHMKVQIGMYDCVRDMSKELPANRTHGENVGVLNFSAATVTRLQARAAARIASGGQMEWLGSAVREVLQDRHIRGVDIAGLPWAEIDFAYDLDRARRDVWPAILASKDKQLGRRHPRVTPLHRAAAVAAVMLAMVLVFAATSNAWNGPAHEPAPVAGIDDDDDSDSPSTPDNRRGGIRDDGHSDDLRTEVSRWVKPGLDDGFGFVRLSRGTRFREWVMLDAAQPLELDISDHAGRIEIQVRAAIVLNPDAAAAPAEFGDTRLDVSLNGQFVAAMVASTDESGSWTHDGHRISRCSRLDVVLPEGPVKVTLRDAGVSGDTRLLVRLREWTRVESINRDDGAGD